jgi:DNA-directed RNA polymerase subunit L/DNA-directed RNA polymerase alpha subunit
MVFQNLESVDRRTLKFILSPTRVTYANTLRRAIQTEVKILGFRADMTEDGTTTDVKVFKNTTAMSNEMLADRIGLVPIKFPDSFVKEWEKERVLFRLHVKNETEEIRYVTASDFQCLENRPEGQTAIPNTQFFEPDPVSGDTCLIAILKPMVDGQEPEEIHLEAYASLGRGREHTRFNPTSQCSYGYTRDEDPARLEEIWTTWLREQKKVDPKDLEKDPERDSQLEREFRSLEIYRCFKADPDGEPYSFDFTIESLGTMRTFAIVSDALSAIAALCDKYASIDRGELPENVEIQPADARLKGFDFWFRGEDHTLGNLLQTWIDDNLIDAPTSGISFAGYKVPHPLRDEMVLRVGCEDGKEATVRLAIAQAAAGCADMFRKWLDEWLSSISGLPGTTPKSPNFGAPEPVGPWEAHAASKPPVPAPAVKKTARPTAKRPTAK